MLGVRQGAIRTAPGAGNSVTVGTTAATTITLTASLLDRYLWIQAATNTVHFRVGTTTTGLTAVTTDAFIQSGEREDFYFDAETKYVSAIARGGAATLIYTPVSR